MAAETTARIIQDSGSSFPLFLEKSQLFSVVDGASGATPMIDRAIELAAKGEALHASLAKGGGTSERSGRNQLAALHLAIAGAAARYVDSPSIDTAMMLGALGVIGNR